MSRSTNSKRSLEPPSEDDLDSLAAPIGEVTLGDMIAQVERLPTIDGSKRHQSQSPAGVKTRAQKRGKTAPGPSPTVSKKMLPPKKPTSKATETAPKSILPFDSAPRDPNRALSQILSPRHMEPLPNAPVVASDVSDKVDQMSVQSSRVSEDITALQERNNELQASIDSIHMSHSVLLKEVTVLKKAVKSLQVEISQRESVVPSSPHPSANRMDSSSKSQTQGVGGRSAITGQPLEKAPVREDVEMGGTGVGGLPAWKRKQL